MFISQSVMNSFKDACQALCAYDFWVTFAWNDIKVRYRRSRIGQFWITLSIAIFILGVGLFYSQVLHTPVNKYLPDLACGFILWNLMSSIVLEGCRSYIESAPILQQQKLPLIVFPIRVVARNAMIFLHNFILIPVIWLMFGYGNLVYLPFAIAGLFLLLVSGVSVSLVMGMVAARFRDVPQICQSIMQVAFFMTPIIWQPGSVRGKSELVLLLNPFAYYLEIIRKPLLGQPVDVAYWAVALVLTAILAVGSILFYARFRSRIAYWL